MYETLKTGVLAGALTTSLAAGSFALGRVTQTAPAIGSPPPAVEAVEKVEKVATSTTPATSHGLPSFASLVEKVSPAVVHIKVTSVVKTAGGESGLPPGLFGEDGPFEGFGSRGMPPRGRSTQRGAGSGFVIRDDGVVVTNNHVVENAKEITVTLKDGRELTATVMGRDPKTDLAVLKVAAKSKLPVVQLGDSEALSVGDWVVAIGNPFGLSNTVTAGIVSAKERSIGAGPYDHFIQTDAPINPGNSGGPLFDERGNVVGINTAIFSQGGGNVGIGFAIPINLARQLVPELEEHGHVTRGWLGVSIQKLTPEIAESMGIETARGALVGGVTPESPAAAAGIKPGDVITRYDGKVVEDQTSLPLLVAGTPVGKTVPIEILRDGAPQTVDVFVQKLTEADVSDDETPRKGKWGLALRDLTPQERAERELGTDEGVFVADVAPDSPAAEAELQAGDVILRASRQSVGSVAALKREIGKLSDGKPLLLLVRPADGHDRFAALKAG